MGTSAGKAARAMRFACRTCRAELHQAASRRALGDFYASLLMRSIPRANRQLSPITFSQCNNSLINALSEDGRAQILRHCTGFR